MSRDDIYRELSRQPHPHDILVEPVSVPMPSAAVLCEHIERLQSGTTPPRSLQQWAADQLDAHLFPSRDEDDSAARIGEALMQLSVLERLPLSAQTLTTLRGFVRGEVSWAGWMVALQTP